MNAPSRVVSLSPNVSMILFAMNADDQVVGRTRECIDSIRQYVRDWDLTGDGMAARQDTWEQLPIVGDWPKIGAEAVGALKPDLVLTSGSGPFEPDDAAAVKSVNFDTRTLKELHEQIREIGRLLGREERAEEILRQLAEREAQFLSQRTEGPARPTVLFEYCLCIKYHPDPSQRFANPGRFVMAGGYLAPELIALSGGASLFTQPGDTVAWTDFKDIQQEQPDIALIFDCGGCPNAMRHPASQRPGWQDLRAVQTGCDYPLSRNIANPNLCYPFALAELVGLTNAWHQRSSQPDVT